MFLIVERVFKGFAQGHITVTMVTPTRPRSGVQYANHLLKVPTIYYNLTWHKPITTFAEFSDVTSQFVQETLGFAVSVKELKFWHSTVGFVRMRQIGDLKK